MRGDFGASSAVVSCAWNGEGEFLCRACDEAEFIPGVTALSAT